MTLRERGPAPGPARGHERTRVIVAFATMIALVGGYLAVRSSLALPYLSLLEYPIAVALIAFLVWQALRRPRPRAATQAQAPAPAQGLRRHEQLVRTLPDPELLALERALDSWIETGADAERAARILASAASASRGAGDARFAEQIPLLVQKADSRKTRARLVHRIVNGD